jgi:hypothetical protein
MGLRLEHKRSSRPRSPRACSMVPIPSEADEEARRTPGTGGFDQGAAIDRQQDRRHFGDTRGRRAMGNVRCASLHSHLWLLAPGFSSPTKCRPSRQPNGSLCGGG